MVNPKKKVWRWKTAKPKVIRGVMDVGMFTAILVVVTVLLVLPLKFFGFYGFAVQMALLLAGFISKGVWDAGLTIEENEDE